MKLYDSRLKEDKIVAGSLVLITDQPNLNKSMVGFDSIKEEVEGKLVTRLKYNPEKKRELVAIHFQAPKGEIIINVKSFLCAHIYRCTDKEFEVIGEVLPEFFSMKYHSAHVYTQDRKGKTYCYMFWLNREDYTKRQLIVPATGVPKSRWGRKIPIKSGGSYKNFGKVWKNYTAYVLDPNFKRSIREFLSFNETFDESSIKVFTNENLTAKKIKLNNIKMVIVITDDYEFAKKTRAVIDELMELQKASIQLGNQMKGINAPIKKQKSSADSIIRKRMDSK